MNLSTEQAVAAVAFCDARQYQEFLAAEISRLQAQLEEAYGATSRVLDKLEKDGIDPFAILAGYAANQTKADKREAQKRFQVRGQVGR